MNRGKQSASRKQASAVVALGKKCARMAYPNPDRQGCPDASQLRAMAYRDRRCNLTDLPISHVVTCSPCFSQYLRFRQRLVLVTAVKITTAFLALFVVVFASLRLARHDTATVSQPMVAKNSDASLPDTQPGATTGCGHSPRHGSEPPIVFATAWRLSRKYSREDPPAAKGSSYYIPLADRNGTRPVHGSTIGCAGRICAGQASYGAYRWWRGIVCDRSGPH